MSKKSKKPVRGTRDILPEAMKIREEVESRIKKIFTQSGFEQIETPAIENLDLLLDSEGGENLRLLFTIAKRGEKFKPEKGATVKDLCDTGLRYDLTLPLSRFYSNNKEELNAPFKSIQIGDVYRAERPQKGRYRSFKQCDIDIIGDHSIGAEIDLIHTTAKALLEVGLKDFTIVVSDRKLLNKYLAHFGYTGEDAARIAVELDKLDKIGSSGVIKGLEEKGFKDVGELVKTAQRITLEELKSLLGPSEEITALERIIAAIKSNAVDYSIVFDLSLVRGMGYYTGPVFEIRWGDLSYSLGGGGRYDEMVAKTGEDVPAVGFSIGFERLVDLITDIYLEELTPPKKVLLLCDPDTDEMSAVIREADKLRAEGYIVNVTPKRKKLKKQLDHARDHGYSGFLVYGRDTAVRDFS